MSAGRSALLSTLGKLTGAPKTPISGKRNGSKTSSLGVVAPGGASAASPQLARSPATPQPPAPRDVGTMVVSFTRAPLVADILGGIHKPDTEWAALPQFEMSVADMAAHDIHPAMLVCLQLQARFPCQESVTEDAQAWVPFVVGRAWPSRVVPDGTLRAHSRGLLYPDEIEVDCGGSSAASPLREGMLVRVVPCSTSPVAADAVSAQLVMQPCSGVVGDSVVVTGHDENAHSQHQMDSHAGGVAAAATAVNAALAAHSLTGLVVGRMECEVAGARPEMPTHCTCSSTLRFELSSRVLDGLRPPNTALEPAAAGAVSCLQLLVDARRLVDNCAVSLLLSGSGMDPRTSPALALAGSRADLPVSILHRNTSVTSLSREELGHSMTMGKQGPPSTSELPHDRLLEQVLRLARTSLFERSAFEGLSLPAPRGALLVGPPGTGKTLLASRVASHLSVPLLSLSAAGLFSHVIGETEARIRSAFSGARARAPCVLFLDEVDALAPSREPGGGAAGGGPAASESDARAVAALLACMDGLAAKAASSSTPPSGGLSGHGRVFVLAATNRAAAVDAALRRPGRLDTEVLVGAPGEDERSAILQSCLGRYTTHPSLRDPSALHPLARGMHGYVGADIDAVAREAAAGAVRRSCLSRVSDPSDRDSTGAPCVTLGDVRAALRVVQPSALREVAVEVPAVAWGDIAGQAEVKARLLEAVEWPLTHAAAFARMGIRPPRGVLLYGPPGCSKTLMAKAMASQGRMHFISVKGPELFSCYVGDSEKAVAEVFVRARSVAPCVVFFDEFDALAGRRDAEGGGGGGGPSVGTRVVSQLLAELDGITGLKQVVVVAATNRPDLIDPAVLRPGRIDAALYVGPPDAPAIAALVEKQLAGLPHTLSSAERADICDALKGFSGAEIVGIFRDASVRAVAECLPGSPSVRDMAGAAGSAAEPSLCAAHVTAAVAVTAKQITPQMLEFYARFARS